jgi:hypothetical protein
MEALEEVADNVLVDWQNRRLRLWLTSLRDCPDEFGQWAGLVRVRAEFFSDKWQPARSELVERLRQCLDQGSDEAQPPGDVLLPMAADAFEADLVAKGVPRDLAARARDLFTLEPPLAQWKI